MILEIEISNRLFNDFIYLVCPNTLDKSIELKTFLYCEPLKERLVLGTVPH